jgi:DNA-binding response OmpR family regulator/HPt (histidine-containing phosphotransfer) domain-containing protein
MSTTMSVVILDDDQNFRQSVVAILKPRGFTVIEATTAQEASSILATIEPLLVIVDYHLPGGKDGVSWIAQLREQGRNFPIIFTSTDWCDAKTFNWLRNILKVSLILNKPIVPNLFLQQIEPLLPAHVLKNLAPEIDATDDKALPANDEAIILLDKLIGEKESLSKEKLLDLEHLANSVSTDQELLLQLRKFEMKLNVERQLKKAKDGYLGQLLVEWQKLGKLVQSAQQDSNNRLILDEGLQASHRIAGSAGTFGFTKVGEIAKKIEGYLRAYDPLDTLQEVLWNETFRALAEGETLVQAATADLQEMHSEGEPAQVNTTSKTFVLGRLEKFKPFQSYISAHKDTLLVITDDLESALRGIKEQKFDNLIVDLTNSNKSHLFSFIESVRSNPFYSLIPVGVLCDQRSKPDSLESLYHGISVIVDEKPTENILADLISRLQSVGSLSGNLSGNLSGSTRKPRVLVVDDDEKLSGFVKTILGGDDIVVDTLSAPIKIMDVLPVFRPNLAILDVMMPGLSGYDVCRLIRQNEQFKSMPVIFLTSKSTAEGRAAAFQAGGNDFLSKPVMADELLARVHGQIDRLNLYSQTGSANNGFLEPEAYFSRLEEMLVFAKTEKKSVAVCLIAVDEVPNLGNSQSPNSSQEIFLGQLLQSHFRAEDMRGRLGDEVFAIACFDTTVELLARALNKLLERYCDEEFSSGESLNFKSTFSAGLASSLADGQTVEDLLNMANMRMLRGSQSGPGKISSE